MMAQTTPVAAPEVAERQETVSVARTLPETASSLPLVGLVGLASLGAFRLMVCLPKRKLALVSSRRG